ncbi:MAG: hypothetical protein KBT34_08610 [Prevotella sp.]|nr:hypothetical protein [Candidatus Prevotella equi]
MNKIISCTLYFCLIFSLLISCDKEDDNISIKPSTNESSKNTNTEATVKITTPEVTVESRKANATYDGWWVIAKVTTGNDDPLKIKCYLEWSIFSSKQSETITSFQHRDEMNVQASSVNRVLFKKEHAGINRGTYIYFRVVGGNSKYTVTSPTEYMIATNSY